MVAQVRAPGDKLDDARSGAIAHFGTWIMMIGDGCVPIAAPAANTPAPVLTSVAEAAMTQRVT
jgi:hypothetical protein